MLPSEGWFSCFPRRCSMARPRSAKKFRGFLVHAHPFNWTKKSVAKIMASGRSVESHAASQRELLVGGFTADVPAWKRSLSTATLPSEPRRARRTQRNFLCALGVLRGSAKGRRKWRFRQPRGGTYSEPEPLNFKRLATWISEVPPKVGGHPPCGRRTDNTDC